LSALITLLTDFGDADGFVGAMRGVLKTRAPQSELVDLAHHVPRGDVSKASRVLARSAVCFPRQTVHLVVVDPGVGSARRALVMRLEGHLFVAPDNGVLDGVCDVLGVEGTTREVKHHALFAPTVSPTFHGRDVFAPTAGALAAGFDFDAVGPLVVDRVHLPTRVVQRVGAEWRGQVVEQDQYGNLITNLKSADVGPSVCIRFGSHCLMGPRASYSSVASGGAVLVVGSAGTLEIAVRDGSAANHFGIDAGAEVSCSRVDEETQSAP